MKKYWVTVENDVFDKLNKLANDEGLSIGALSAKHLTSLVQKEPSQLETALKKMTDNLENKNDPYPFNISGIVNDDEMWNKLTRSEKMIMAKSLSRYIKDHEDRFEVYKVENSVRFYRLK